MKYSLRSHEPNPYESPKEGGSTESRPWFSYLTVVVGGIAALMTLLVLAVVARAFFADI